MSDASAIEAIRQTLEAAENAGDADAAAALLADDAPEPAGSDVC